MKKGHTWRDLNAYVKIVTHGRKHEVVSRLLKGETVDLGKFGSAPQKKLYSKRSPSAFRGECKKLLAGHKGVKIDGNIVSIPELQSHKSFLKNV